jgi:hypothetical protein
VALADAVVTRSHHTDAAAPVAGTATEPKELEVLTPYVEPPARTSLPHLQNLVASNSRPQIYAAAPQRIAGPASAPQLTLPGPALPPELERFEDGNIVTVLGPEPKAKPGSLLPGWLISLVVAISLLLAGVAVVFYILPSSSPATGGEGASTQSQPAAMPAPAVAPQALGKSLEITGFRIGVDLTNRTVVQYIVVNHSTREISNANVNVVVRSAHGHFSRTPVVTFSFRLPAVGPLESREMTTVLESPLKPGDVPDWQSLRPEIQTSE